MLLCEAGQDTPPGDVPKEILDSYSGTAYFDPRFQERYRSWAKRILDTKNPHTGLTLAHRRSRGPAPATARIEATTLAGILDNRTGEMLYDENIREQAFTVDPVVEPESIWTLPSPPKVVSTLPSGLSSSTRTFAVRVAAVADRQVVVPAAHEHLEAEPVRSVGRAAAVGLRGPRHVDVQRQDRVHRMPGGDAAHVAPVDRHPLEVGRAAREMYVPPFEFRETIRQLYELGLKSAPLMRSSASLTSPAAPGPPPEGCARGSSRPGRSAPRRSRRRR